MRHVSLCLPRIGSLAGPVSRSCSHTLCHDELALRTSLQFER